MSSRTCDLLQDLTLVSLTSGKVSKLDPSSPRAELLLLARRGTLSLFSPLGSFIGGDSQVAPAGHLLLSLL